MRNDFRSNGSAPSCRSQIEASSTCRFGLTHCGTADECLPSNMTLLQTYRHIRNYYLSNSKTFQDGNGNGDFGEINSNDFQDGDWESMDIKVRL